MTNDVIEFEFQPLVLPGRSSVDLNKQLEAGISKMERRRAWSDVNGQYGIRSLLGEIQAKHIEDIISKGNSSIVEVGGGHLEASKEIAKKNPSNKIIAIEPFVEDSDLSGIPQNLSVVAKAIENVTITDIPDESIDAVFSGGHVWNYIQDKLGCIQRVWQMLKPGGFGVIEYMGQSISPSMQEIIDRFQLGDLIRIEKTGAATQVIIINKPTDKQFSFGKYTYSSLSSGNLAGDVYTYYEFQA